LITKIERIGTSLTFELHESPWLDEDRFVYSLSNEKQIIVGDTGISSLQGDASGIYIYNIITNQKMLLIPEARFAVCSPTDSRIGYIMDQTIWVMSLKDKSTETIFKVGLQDRIINIHWTPDGKFMYIAYYKQNDVGQGLREEKLIDIKTKNEVLFKKIGHGFRSYTWK
jgi:hypothetical protein